MRCALFGPRKSDDERLLPEKNSWPCLSEHKKVSKCGKIRFESIIDMIVGLVTGSGLIRFSLLISNKINGFLVRLY